MLANGGLAVSAHEVAPLIDTRLQGDEPGAVELGGLKFRGSNNAQLGQRRDKHAALRSVGALLANPFIGETPHQQQSVVGLSFGKSLRGDDRDVQSGAELVMLVRSAMNWKRLAGSPMKLSRVLPLADAP